MKSQFLLSVEEGKLAYPPEDPPAHLLLVRLETTVLPPVEQHVELLQILLSKSMPWRRPQCMET